MIGAPAFDWDGWRARRAATRAAFRAHLRAYLAGDQHDVTESWDSASGRHTAIWYCGAGRLAAPYDTDPDHLADHLVDRHFGFGFALEVHGITYRDGIEAAS